MKIALSTPTHSHIHIYPLCLLSYANKERRHRWWCLWRRRAFFRICCDDKYVRSNKLLFSILTMYHRSSFSIILHSLECKTKWTETRDESLFTQHLMFQFVLFFSNSSYNLYRLSLATIVSVLLSIFFNIDNMFLFSISFNGLSLPLSVTIFCLFLFRFFRGLDSL